MDYSSGMVPNAMMPTTSHRNEDLANEVNTHGWETIVSIFSYSEALSFNYIFFLGAHEIY